VLVVALSSCNLILHFSEPSLEVQGGHDYFRFVEGTCIIVLCLFSLSLWLFATCSLWLSLQKLNSICFWTVTTVGENEEKANTIQPPFLCFSHLHYHVVEFLPICRDLEILYGDVCWFHDRYIFFGGECYISAATVEQFYICMLFEIFWRHNVYFLNICVIRVFIALIEVGCCIIGFRITSRGLILGGTWDGSLEYHILLWTPLRPFLTTQLMLLLVLYLPTRRFLLSRSEPDILQTHTRSSATSEPGWTVQWGILMYLVIQRFFAWCSAYSQSGACWSTCRLRGGGVGVHGMDQYDLCSFFYDILLDLVVILWHLRFLSFFYDLIRYFIPFFYSIIFRNIIMS